jgi:hypothetical protein
MTTNPESSTQRLIRLARERAAAMKAARHEPEAVEAVTIAQSIIENTPEEMRDLIDPVDAALAEAGVELNPEQLEAVTRFVRGESFIVNGPAGSGKTFTKKWMIKAALIAKTIPILREPTKHLQPGLPAIACVAFTNMAVRQVQKHVGDLGVNTLTMHKLIEFAPVFYEIPDEKSPTGFKKTMRFEPSRHELNPLPRLRTLDIDEGSMAGTRLFRQVDAAMRDGYQLVVTGDLNQLPDFEGDSVLARLLPILPVVNLHRIYRQALASPIIEIATDIRSADIKKLNGKWNPAEKTVFTSEDGRSSVEVAYWPKRESVEKAINRCATLLYQRIDKREFDEYLDISLCPQISEHSKSGDVMMSATNINKQLAQWLHDKKVKAGLLNKDWRFGPITEVIAGFKKHYLAVGDKLLVQKRECMITNIAVNREYSGVPPLSPLHYELNRWGAVTKVFDSSAPDDLDFHLESATNVGDGERKMQASHSITVRFLNGTHPDSWSTNDTVITNPDYETATLEAASELNEQLFGYCCSVHRSQGSEWGRVILFFHHSIHPALVSRELMYTGMTRASRMLTIICDRTAAGKPGHLLYAAQHPRIPGTTIEDKLTFLKKEYARKEAEKPEEDRMPEDWTSKFINGASAA